jgi:tripartite motif-containing protein 71
VILVAMVGVGLAEEAGLVKAIIRKIVIATGVVTTFAGNSTSGYTDGTGTGARFSVPKGIMTDGTNLYVADTGNSRIQKFSASGAYITQWGGRGSGDGQFSSPRGVAVDSTGNVYVADMGNHRIQKFKPVSNLNVNMTGTGAGSVTVNTGTLTWNGNIGAASYDIGTSVILTATPGAYTTFIGWLGGSCSGKGTCTTTLNGDTFVRAVFSGLSESVWTWGNNDVGQLGSGNYANSPIPVQVSGLGNVIAIAGGSSHTIALKSDGTVTAWGYNGFGQCNVPPGLSGVIAIAGGQ